MNQASQHILLIRPANFGFNAETAVSNAFQNNPDLSSDEITKRVLSECDNFATLLISKGVNAIVCDDTQSPVKPDAIFPNNWVSFHPDGTVILYPMCTPNRRLERRMDIIEKFREKFKINNIADFSHYEKENKFLEGTGSIVFDHENKVAYACISPRTDKTIFSEVAAYLGYEPMSFQSVDEQGKEIYHTNVMMCVAKGFAVVCLDSIKNEMEREKLVFSLTSTGHEIIAISYGQMKNFAGNMLSVKGNSAKPLLVCSQRAWQSLNQAQKATIEKHCEALAMKIPTVETIGGGGARCMMAEVFSDVLAGKSENFKGL